jgi:peptidoglycan/LPS O-acetylase OafA/YrhL
LAGLAVYWSLAVEEKFYIVYPLIFIAIAVMPVRWISLRSRLAAVLAVIVVASFVYAYSLNPLAAYVSTPARAWELALGGLLAVGTVWLKRIPELMAALITWVGLGGLFFVVLYEPLTFWPHALPVLPVVATSLIIAGGTAFPGFGSELILSLRPLQYLALWSFSLYLVHKPIDVWAVQFIGRPLSLFEEIAVAAIAIGVAAVCYALIETPIRHARLLTRSGPASIGIGVALIASCVILTITVP